MLDGACRVGDVIARALEDGAPAVAITDHGVLYGTIDFYRTAQAKGVRPIIGCETYITSGSRFDRKEEGPRNATYHLVLLAENEVGYRSLMKLITAAHLEGFYYKPRIDKALLAECHEGLIGLSACLKGEVAAHLAHDDLRAAVKAAGEYAEIFGADHFFLEIQDHGLPDQRRVNRLLLELAAKTGLPLVVTNDVHYLKREHAAAHEVLLCLQTQTVMSDPKRMRYGSDEFFMKTRAEMEAVFRELPEALDRTLEIADRCCVEIEFDKLHFPVFQTPKGKTQREYLLELGYAGLAWRYGITDPANPADERQRQIVERFKDEMEVIEKTGFVNYFLVVWDFVRFARERRIPVGPGRGSGGGSIVAYVLGITAIDPLAYGLIFERFLNPHRVSPPDFDIDFCQLRRGEVIEYVKQKYGRENVAQIITFGSLGAKQVVRDVGRVLEISFSKCDQLAKMIPEGPKVDLKQALESSPEFRQAYETDPDCRRILDYAFVLEGLYRNPGTHAAGVVISEKPLKEIIPLARDKDGELITQYAMEPLQQIGLLKMDFLGLKTLTVIHETVELVRQTHGIEIDLDKLPLDDKVTYDLLNRGDTVGVFQLESSGMRDLIRRIGISNIEDLIAVIALYRPGPMNMLADYTERKTGKAKIKYDHPLLEPILKDTYGVMVYQEQVQQAAHVLAGYSLGEADLLRRAMGKKKPEEMAKHRARFIEGCRRLHHIDARVAGIIFDHMEQFAGYGFNKAHSAGYAVIAYQTAYLKANYPVEFMAALISSEMGNSDKLPVFIAEATEMGLQILPPDVNQSGVRFRPVGRAIRFGLAGIKNVGEGAAEAIVREREAHGPFKGLVDFCSRLDSQLVNRKVLESLIRAGAMDCFGEHRARLFNAVSFAMARAANVISDRNSGQVSLFALLGTMGDIEPREELPDCEPWRETELLAAERELLGVYLSGHPLSQYASLLETYQLASIAQLTELADRTPTRIGGIIAGVSKKVSKTSKETWAILQLEGLDGSLEVLLFADVFRKYSSVLVPNEVVIVCGEVFRRDEQAKLVAQEIYPLVDAPRLFAKHVGIHIPVARLEDNILEAIRDVLCEHPGPTPVLLCLQYPSGEKVILDTERRFRVVADQQLIRKLRQMLGEQSVFVAVSAAPCRRNNGSQNRQRSGIAKSGVSNTSTGG